MSQDTDLSPLAQALGRVPTGLYIVSTLGGERRALGFVGSFVMQVGFEPPTLCVAIGKGRDHLAAIRATGSFAVSILDGASQGLMGPFFKPCPDGTTPFDGLETAAAPSGPPVLTGALAWLDCELTGEHETGDHVVVFGRITAGERLREGDPAIHLRKNGLGY
jgi:flavin reductase (DIM6/NTAB) family NADH-FMN oxidoreductase RutF